MLQIVFILVKVLDFFFALTQSKFGFFFLFFFFLSRNLGQGERKQDDPEQGSPADDDREHPGRRPRGPQDRAQLYLPVRAQVEHDQVFGRAAARDNPRDVPRRDRSGLLRPSGRRSRRRLPQVVG